MGEDLFNFVLSDINGIPALPVFIGNYLLDLLSTFFPIFVLLSAFVMLYTGLTRGGDWKSTGQQLAPTAISMAVIMGLLSMKTPYTSADGGAIGGSFWQDTNSYTVVEMMNTFLGFGNIFADALTHKIIYGSIEVTNGNTNFDGYFPAVLQAMIDKDKSAEIKQFLLNTANRKDIVDKVDSSNASLAAGTKTLVTNLHNLGVVDDFRRVRGDVENSGTDVGGYKQYERKRYFEMSKQIYNNGFLFYYTPMSNIKEVDPNTIGNISSVGNEEEPKCSLNNTECKKTININVNVTNDDTDQETFVLDVNKVIKLKYNSYGPGSLKSISEGDEKSILTFLNKRNFEQEGNMIVLTKTMLENYIAVYKSYEEELSKIQGKASSGTKSDKALLDSITQSYLSQMEKLKGHIEAIASFYKEYQIIYAELSNEAPLAMNTGAIDEIMGSGFYKGLETRKFFSQNEIDKIYYEKAKIEVQTVPYFFAAGKERENSKKIMETLNTMMQAKAYITIVMYDKFKGILQDDALFQVAMGFASKSAFNRLYLDLNKLNALTYMDKQKEDITKQYFDDISGKEDVAKKLNEDIKKQYSSTEFGKGTVIHWTDLGKHYATFKNLYSPMITNIYALQKANSLDIERAASMAQFMQELEPSAKTTRLLNAAAIMAGGVAAIEGGKLAWAGLKKLNVAGIVKDQVKNATKDDKSFSSIFDVIKIIGGMYFAILFINVILPAFIWMFVIITYYIEMSLYVAVFPLGFMFMIFQSYRQSLHQYINMLLGFILMPVVLVSMYFVVLYIDMLLPMFFKQFMPFFGNYNELSGAFNLAFAGSDSILNDVMGGITEVAAKGVDKVKSMAGKEDLDLTSMIGNALYTFLSMMMSTLLLMTFFRANEYMSKILNVSTIGMDSFQGQSTLNKFGSFDKSGLTAGVVGR